MSQTDNRCGIKRRTTRALVALATISVGCTFISIPSCKGLLTTFNPGDTIFSSFSATDINGLWADVPDWELDPTCTIPYYGINHTTTTGGTCADHDIYSNTPGRLESSGSTQGTSRTSPGKGHARSHDCGYFEGLIVTGRNNVKRKALAVLACGVLLNAGGCISIFAPTALSLAESGMLTSAIQRGTLGQRDIRSHVLMHKRQTTHTESSASCALTSESSQTACYRTPPSNKPYDSPSTSTVTPASVISRITASPNRCPSWTIDPLITANRDRPPTIMPSNL